MTTLTAFHPYSISGGGLFARVDAWLRLPPDAEWAWRRRAIAYVLVAYVPALVVGSVLRLITGHWDPLITQIETHVRALVTAPLLLFAEHVVDNRSREAGEYLLHADIVREEDAESYTRAVARTERLRNSVAVDGLLLMFAVASQLVDVTSVFHVHKPAHFWGNFVALVLFRYLLFRWVWRWSLWTTFLARVARMRLELSSLHPDRAGGLGELATPSEAFSLAAMAGAATLASAWLDRMREGAHLADFYGAAATWVFLAVAFAVVPLLMFTARLYALRRKGRFGYGAFARRYCDAFQRAWFGRSGQEALGAQDIQALADLGNSYGVLTDMRVFVCDRRMVVTIAAASILPMLPLALVQFSVLDLVLHLLKALS